MGAKPNNENQKDRLYFSVIMYNIMGKAINTPDHKNISNTSPGSKKNWKL